MRWQRRRDVIVILAVLGVMLVSMAAGVYMYIVDPDGLEALFPGGAQAPVASPMRW